MDLAFVGTCYPVNLVSRELPERQRNFLWEAQKPCCQANDSLGICFNLGSCQEENLWLTAQT